MSVLGLFKTSPALGLYRYCVRGAERVDVSAGVVMLCPLRVLRVDGLLRVDGVVKIGG